MGWLWWNRLVRVHKDVQGRGSVYLTQGRYARGRRRGGGDGRSERKASGGILGGHGGQTKGLGVGLEMDRISVDKMKIR